MINKDKEIIFIDMDGTLIHPYGNRVFPKCIADMYIIWDTWNSLRDWAASRTKIGYVFIVTNQGGIETGQGSNERFIRAKLEYITAALQEYLDMTESKVVVDYAYCKSNNKNDPNRKPGTGMLIDLIQKYNLDYNNKTGMVMIGDASGIHTSERNDFSDSDIRTADNFSIDYLDYKEL